MAIIRGTNQQKFVYIDGSKRVEIAKTFSAGNKEIITGTSDAYEAWQGITTIEYQDDFGERTAFEEVNIIDG